ncbi:MULTISPECIES: molybdopterin-binding protein [unclassified Streptomyces]|uniref:TOBE domain-containing protein n=1 Tax=unclassified Streptomyces TaxID=2593676 RepID=UPI00380159E3
MALSIRNQIAGKAESVVTGEVMAVVTVHLDGGGPAFTAAVTAEAVRELGIIPGGGVTVLIKATEISLATPPLPGGLTIRNRVPGTVTAVTEGQAMATVRLAFAGGRELTAVITREALDELRLAEGSEVVALVKSTDVALST